MTKFQLILTCMLMPASAYSQTGEPYKSRLPTWLPFQAIPSLTLYSSRATTAFGFEWEATPLLYSFGMNHQVSPWYSFIVEPTARFSGSVELTIAGQLFTSKPDKSYFSSTTQVMAYIPVFERGEHLTFNLGIGMFQTHRSNLFYTAAGVSSVFGMMHVNVKHAANPETWICSLEARIF